LHAPPILPHSVCMKPTDFGVQSFCFRHFKDNVQVAKMVRQIGLDKIEICGIHADLNNPEAFSEVVKIYREEGVSIISIGVQTCRGQDSEQRWFECVQRAGANHISIHLTVDTFGAAIARLRAWSREFGVRLGLHTHGGYMFGGSPDVARHLLQLGSPEIGLCLDTAWIMQIGPRRGNPIQWVNDFPHSIYGVHYKDFVFDRNAQWEDVVVGEGNLPLAEFVRALETIGFDGMPVIEYEADVENPVPALTRCVERMRELTGAA